MTTQQKHAVSRHLSPKEDICVRGTIRESQPSDGQGRDGLEKKQKAKNTSSGKAAYTAQKKKEVCLELDFQISDFRCVQYWPSITTPNASQVFLIMPSPHLPHIIALSTIAYFACASSVWRRRGGVALFFLLLLFGGIFLL